MRLLRTRRSAIWVASAPTSPAQLGARAPHLLGDLRLGRLDQPRGLLPRLGREPLPQLPGLAQRPLPRGLGVGVRGPDPVLHGRELALRPFPRGLRLGELLLDGGGPALQRAQQRAVEELVEDRQQEEEADQLDAQRPVDLDEAPPAPLGGLGRAREDRATPPPRPRPRASGATSRSGQTHHSSIPCHVSLAAGDVVKKGASSPLGDTTRLRRVSSGARDDAAADDHLASVEHDRLPGRDRVLGLAELDLEPSGAGRGRRGPARAARGAGRAPRLRAAPRAPATGSG